MRRRFLKWIAGSFAIGSFAALGHGWLSPSLSMAVDTANLQQTLEKGLYARLPVQFEFIAAVIFLVEQDKIPLKLVYSTFKWAQQYDKGRRYYYFEIGMRKRAARIGVEI
ncbi:hypothetical protein [Blastopirellula marina]|uniref:Uncharacterized protein n=1 Tax=Blastopirellula marina TaxID=124 RepID=A0A2S8F4M6_9BACT|nr:hypothetical protein [Blastopirellula marina]PQO27115.1 hypothetical protein C5Y98_28100 [Blastopirellula marina]PTL41262.1 hypothetical protein C5Y97_28115 [Blastopirellula marina]